MLDQSNYSWGQPNARMQCSICIIDMQPRRQQDGNFFSTLQKRSKFFCAVALPQAQL
jgi:hypothetical protein